MSEDLRCRSCGAPLEVRGHKERIIRCEYCGTDHNLPGRGSTAKAEYDREFIAKLYRVIDENFTTEEMQDLVVQLNIKLPAPYKLQYDDIPGNSQKSRARELVLWCQRRMVLQELVDVVLSIRPSVEWS